MAEAVVRDTSWEVDLLQRYLLDHQALKGRIGYPSHAWYRQMDPGGTLESREHVYELLVKKSSLTNPKTQPEVEASMLPWNQQNKAILERWKGTQVCGSMVKMMFRRYMGWGLEDVEREPGSRDVDGKWDAPGWVVKSLKALQPVRARLQERPHRIGIVGYRGREGSYEFLCIEPWAGNPGHPENEMITLSYAGTETAFLGLATQVGKRLRYGNDKVKYWIGQVEGYIPLV